MNAVQWRSAALILIIAAAAGCNAHQPLVESVTGPTVVPMSNPSPSIWALELSPGGTIGGGAGEGILFLDFPAPEGGLVVDLSASDSSTTVTPARLAVAVNAVTARFAFSTRAVSGDRTVNIVARYADRSYSAPLGVWAVLPTFVNYSSDRGAPIGAGRSRRFVPDNAHFHARCESNIVSGRVGATSGPLESLSFVFGTRTGQKLAPGVYDNARGDARGGALLSVTESTCETRNPPVGRFTVHESEFASDGRVIRFWATFEQTCEGQLGAIRGDVRLSNVPLSTPGGRCTSPR